MTAHPPQPDPLAAVLAMMDAGEALAAAARLATEAEDRRRLVGMADGRPLPAAVVAAVVGWQTAADDAELCLYVLAEAIGRRMPAPPAPAAAPPLGRAA